MAARLLSAAGGAAVLVAVSCQVGPVAIVECRTTRDCEAGYVCSPAHACVSSENTAMMPPPDGGAGESGMPEGGPAEPVIISTPLAWGADSRIAADNPFGMRGGWYVADDCADVQKAVADGRFVCPPSAPTPACCTLWDASLTGPSPDHHPGLALTPGTAADGNSRLCLKGTVTQVLRDPMNEPAFGVQWGAIAALPLNDGIDYDTTAALPGGKLLGFSFDLDGPPSTAPVRVGFQTRTNDLYFVDFDVPARGARLLFAEVMLGDWVMPQVPFEGSQVAALGFDVTAEVDGTKPVDFCVSNLRVLQEGSTASDDMR